MAERTPTQVENHELWLLSQRIRNCPTLRNAIAQDSPGAFFEHLETSEEGRAFLAEYREFVARHPHRGHADRDFWFPRRIEDARVDVNTLRAYLDVDDDPLAREEAVNDRQRARHTEVCDNIRRGPLGVVKVEAFKVVMRWLQDFLVWRDTERHFVDRSSFTLKRIALEAGRRYTERGLADTDTDFYFLSVEELFTALAGGGSPALRRAKVAARTRDHGRFLRREVEPPMYLHRGVAVDLDAPTEDDAEGVFLGIGISAGTVTGTARVIKSQDELHRLNKGEILVCNSTDPGWTTAFNLIAAIVTETGGAMAHAAGLAREYGLPAAQVARAMQKIPDGATITVDGSAGRVVVLAEQQSPTELEAIR